MGRRYGNREGIYDSRAVGSRSNVSRDIASCGMGEGAGYTVDKAALFTASGF